MAEPAAARCPSLVELETLAAGEATVEALADHVEHCPSCRRQLDVVRENNALMARLVGSRPGLGAVSGRAGDAAASPAIDGYENLVELHRGGQGVVYRALQTATNRTVALKVLLAGAFATSRQRLRFEREIDLVAALRHSNIVTVYDSGVATDGRHWFAMEYLEGETLDQHVEARRDPAAVRRLTLRETLRLFSKICAAVSHAHQRGVMHRDLKPGNVIVDEHDEPQVLDFGLAKPVDPEIGRQQATVTVAGGFVGTLAYASPEQTTGDPGQVDIRSDVYALGVILYEMLAGRFPYAVTGRMSDVIDAITKAPPRSLRTQRGLPYRIGEELDTIVSKALAKEPDRRYQSVEALRGDIEHYLAGKPIDAKRDSGWYVLTKTLLRYKLQVAAAALLVVMLTGFGIAMSVLYRQARNEADKVTKINVFLEDTLGSVEPPGRGEVTVRNFLDEGVYWIDVALAEQPEIEASVRTIIGNAYRNVGRLQEAEAQLLQGLRTRRELFGDRHVQVAKSLSSLGLLRLAQQRHEEAEEYFQQALDLRRDLLGDDHLEAAAAMMNLATLKRLRGEPDAAERLLRHALAVRRTRLGEQHSDVAMCQFSLARVFEDRGAVAGALALHQRALATRRSRLHEDHPDLTRSLIALGSMHLRMEQPRSAEPLLREALDHQQRVLPEGHWRTARTRRLLGVCLTALGRYAEAEPLLLKGYDGLESTLGAGNPETAETLEALIGLYEAWPKPDEAQRWWARSIE
ncbi:MAG: serine/threonine-protein kinase [Planctomycetota bacterium]|jgi:serine/threonine-protein kinase